jgi:hypothetical protein
LPVRHAGGKRNDLALVKNRDGKRQMWSWSKVIRKEKKGRLSIK